MKMYCVTHESLLTYYTDPLKELSKIATERMRKVN